MLKSSSICGCCSFNSNFRVVALIAWYHWPDSTRNWKSCKHPSGFARYFNTVCRRSSQTNSSCSSIRLSQLWRKCPVVTRSWYHMDTQRMDKMTLEEIRPAFEAPALRLPTWISFTPATLPWSETSMTEGKMLTKSRWAVALASSFSFLHTSFLLDLTYYHHGAVNHSSTHCSAVPHSWVFV